MNQIRQLMFIVWLVVTMASRLAAQPNVPVKLALITESASVQPAADLLTASFSTNASIQLLERDQIEKVYHEQALSAGNTDYLKLGRLLGADGLMIVSMVQENTGQFLALRLVAVKPGVVLKAEKFLWPVKNLNEWSGGLASQVDAFLPKLAVLPKEAIPLSVVNLRSVVASSEAAETEKELKLLAIERLSEERQLFVLERQKLRSAEDEKILSADESAFWDGSYLLEGVVDQNGYSPETITIDARLTPPKGGTVVKLAISGSRTNLAAVVDALVGQVMAALQVNSTVKAWSAADEAQQYFAEAQWALRWGAFEEEEAAADSAWALGRQTKDVAELRIKACLAAAGQPGKCMILDGDRQVVFGGQINPHINDMMEITAFPSVPAAGRFTCILRAARLYAGALDRFLTPDQKLDADWLQLGTQIVDQTSMWLRYYYFTVEARAGQEDGIEDAKKLCWDITQKLETRPDFAVLDVERVLLTLKARHVAFWLNSPAQVLSVYRGLLEAKAWPRIRIRFLNDARYETRLEGVTRTLATEGMGNDGGPPSSANVWANLANPCLAGWDWPARARCPELWDDFIAELCASQKPWIRLEGQALKCSYAWSEADFETNLDQLMDFLRQQQDGLLGNGLDEELGYAITALVAKRAEHVPDKWARRLRDEKLPAINHFFDGLKSQLTAIKQTQESHAALQVKINYLTSQTNFDVGSFVQVMSLADCQPEDARKLLPYLDQYESRITNAPGMTNADRPTQFRRQAEQHWVEFQIRIVRQNLNNMITPPAKNTVPTASPRLPVAVVVPKTATIPGPGQPLAPANHRPASLAGSPAAPPIIIRRFWAVPSPAEIEKVEIDGSRIAYNFMGDNYCPQIISFLYRDGKLWLEVRYDRIGIKGRADFFKVDPMTFQTEVITLTGADNSISHRFEVLGGYLYVALDNGIRRYSFQTGEWDFLPVQASGAMPQRLGDRLFFVSGSSILEYMADGSFHTLASTKRQPAMNLLDALPDYGTPHLFLADGGKVHVCLQQDVYELLDAAGEWRHIATLPRVHSDDFYPADDGFIAATGVSGDDWWGMLGDATRPEYLLHQPARFPQMISGFQPVKPAPPHWRAPLPGSLGCTRGDSAWFLAGSPKLQNEPSGHLKVQAETADGLALVRFKYSESDPLTVPIQFDPECARLSPEAAAAPVPFSFFVGFQRQWKLEWIPQGFAMLRVGGPGFWLIASNDLAQAVARNDAARQGREQAITDLHERWRRELAAMYGRQADGAFSPESREAMIDNAHYLELELSHIDTNRDGLLEANELAFFDANQNGILEPREQAAIEQVLSLQAAQLLAKSSPDANGRINQADLPDELTHLPSRMNGEIINMGAPQPAKLIGQDEVVVLLHNWLNRTLRETSRILPQLPLSGLPDQPVDSAALFKMRVESYWKQADKKPRSPAAPLQTNP